MKLILTEILSIRHQKMNQLLSPSSPFWIEFCLFVVEQTTFPVIRLAPSHPPHRHWKSTKHLLNSYWDCSTCYSWKVQSHRWPNQQSHPHLRHRHLILSILYVECDSVFLLIQIFSLYFSSFSCSSSIHLPMKQSLPPNAPRRRHRHRLHVGYLVPNLPHLTLYDPMNLNMNLTMNLMMNYHIHVLDPVMPSFSVSNVQSMYSRHIQVFQR
mmetsp:Transcript_11884/g.17385  ORF Transcript_11884/g.17385 Transcript_11884/m.17385 type:complete len:211 (-) Transcript_11884:2983-3615(-)